MPTPHAPRGFTLAELLVVIAIITILAAIFFPVFNNAKQAARRTQCVANQRQLGLLVIMAAGDNNDILPSSRQMHKEFLHQGKIMHCPADTSDMAMDYGYNPWVAGLPIQDLSDPSTVEIIADCANDSGVIFGWKDIALRHRDGAIYTFADGHVDFRKGLHSVAYGNNALMEKLTPVTRFDAAATGWSGLDTPTVNIYPDGGLHAGNYVEGPVANVAMDASGGDITYDMSRNFLSGSVIEAWTMSFYTKIDFTATRYNNWIYVEDPNAKVIMGTLLGNWQDQHQMWWNDKDMMPPVSWTDTNAVSEREEYLGEWHLFKVTVIGTETLCEWGERSENTPTDTNPIIVEQPILNALNDPARQSGTYSTWTSPYWYWPQKLVMRWMILNDSVTYSIGGARLGIMPRHAEQ